MATTTRVLALELLSSAMDDWWSAVTTSAGSTTTIVDTKLAQLSDDDDFCLNWYVRNVATGEIRLVTGYTASSTTITHVAMTTAVALGGTYELHRVNPTLKHNALNRAVSQAFPKLYLPIIDETLCVDNLLSNWDFETYAAGAFTGWTATNITVAAETSRVWHGSKSAKLTASAANGRFTQNLFSSVNIHEIAGKTLHIRARIWSDTADEIRLQVTFDGSTYTSSAYHGGKDEWEGRATIYIDKAVPDTATEMTVAVHMLVNGAVAYVDNVIAYIDPIYKYTIPTSILRGPHFVSQQYDENYPLGPYYRLGEGQAPTAGRILRLEGMGLLTQPTTDAGTYEIGDPRTELLVAHAMRYLARAGFLKGGQYQRSNQAEELRLWELEIARLEARPGIAMPAMSAEIPEAWEVGEDSSGRYIRFTNPR